MKTPDPSKLTQEELESFFEHSALAKDPVAFAIRLGFTPDPWQIRLLRSRCSRRLMNCSRQVGKSTTTSLLVTHRALFEPESLILLVSPSERQSHEIFRKAMGWFKLFMPNGEDVIAENKTTLELKNGSRIVSLPSQESTIRSFSGVSLLVFDEASRVPDDLYGATRPMLLASKGDLVALSSPWGKRGWFFQEWDRGGDLWERYRVPVISVPRLMQDPDTRKFLEEERASRGERFFKQEYLCEFVETEDGVFSEDLIDAAFDSRIKPVFDGEATPAEVEGAIAPLDFGDVDSLS